MRTRLDLVGFGRCRCPYREYQFPYCEYQYPYRLCEQQGNASRRRPAASDNTSKPRNQPRIGHAHVLPPWTLLIAFRVDRSLGGLGARWCAVGHASGVCCSGPELYLRPCRAIVPRQSVLAWLALLAIRTILARQPRRSILAIGAGVADLAHLAGMTVMPVLAGVALDAGRTRQTILAITPVLAGVP